MTLNFILIKAVEERLPVKSAEWSGHRYLIYLDRVALLGVQIKESPFIKCIQTGFMLLHTDLWLISED